MKLLRFLPAFVAVACASSPEREVVSGQPAATTVTPHDEAREPQPTARTDGRGISALLDAPTPGGVTFIDYRATPENERAIEEILGGARIPFHMEAAPSGGWGPKVVRLDVTVGPEDVERAGALLRSAQAEGRLDAVEGISDLISRF